MKRPPRPARVDLIPAVAHANDARFVARARPRMPRTIGFEQRHTFPAQRQRQRSPRTKHSRADHDNVIVFRASHGATYPTARRPHAGPYLSLSAKPRWTRPLPARRVVLSCGRRNSYLLEAAPA